MNDDLSSRFQYQDAQYEFPYHYIPHATADGGVSSIRALSWGIEYMAYQTYVAGIIHGLRPSSVLDVGCGDGHLLGLLSRDIPLRMGIDLSSRAIGFALAFNSEVRFECVGTHAVTSQFDVVSAIEVLEHIPDSEVTEFLSELRRLVKPGGSLILCVPTTVVKLNRKHYRHYNSELLASHLAAAGMVIRPEDLNFVFVPSKLLRIYGALTTNRWWVMEVMAARRLIWSHVKRHCLTGSAAEGRHAVVRVRL